MSSYAFLGPRWNTGTITWSFATSGAQFSHAMGDGYKAVVSQAFQKWASVSALVFQQVPDSLEPDIRIGFANLHLQESGISGYTDGAASAKFFSPGSIIRLEDPNEVPLDASSGNFIGSDLVYRGFVGTFYQTVLHEIGHALGLDHSTDPAAVMYPVITAGNRDLDASDTAGISTLYATPSPPVSPLPVPAVSVFDTTASTPVPAVVQEYTGPVAGLDAQYITITPDSLNVTTSTPNWFIHTGSGNDAINVGKGGGSNILDGSTGSNFLIGGSGNDIFYLDDRNATADIWSTVVGFHSGDNAAVWGVTPTDFLLNKFDDQGAIGYLGLTFAFSAANKPNANLTLAGFSTTDLSTGRLTVTFGKTGDLPGVPGSTYMLIHGN